ncbi:MAG: hypothetical protein J6R32_03155 [Bacteroidales bacterium]|nr:hypothetical protein [Bacteroidales bacterium]
MSFNSKMKKHGNQFTFNSDDLPFTSLEEYITTGGNNVIPVKAVFVNSKAQYGPRPVLVSPSFKINLPAHCLEDVQQILTDSELITLINEGKCNFIVGTYEDRNGKMRYTGSFVDA